MKIGAWITAAGARDRGTVAALLRSKRKSAIPARAAQIQEWESEGGSITAPSQIADPLVTTKSG